MPGSFASTVFAASRRAVSASLAEKLSLTIWLFCVSVAWAAIRSAFVVKSASGEVLDNSVPLWIRLAFFAAFVIPALSFFLVRKDRFWLLGLGSTVGILPEVPTIPFVRDNAHFLVILSAAAVVLHWATFHPKERSSNFARIFAGYIAVCGMSVIVNFLVYQIVWQLKVGISFLIFFSALAVMGAQGRKLVQAEFSQEIVVAQTLAIYSELLAQ